MILDVFPDLRALIENGFEDVVCAKPTLMVAMTPRTGSSHLCATLAACGDVGLPTEIFNPRGVANAEKARRGVESFAAYVASFAAQPSAYFAFKTSWNDMAPLAPHMAGIFPNMQIAYLDRRDVVAQAVSLFRAQVTDEWHRRPGERREGPRPEAKFSQAHIVMLIEQLRSEKKNWEGFFANCASAPLRLFYEDFERDFGFAIDKISNGLGIRLDSKPPPGTGFEKLADELNQDWIERVRKDLFRMT